MTIPRENSPGPRRLGLFDLFWLVAVVAVGLAFDTEFLIPWWDRQGPAQVFADMKLRGGIVAPYHIFYWVQLIMPFLIALNLAMIPIRLRSPRPSWRRMLRQPGAVGSLAAALVLVATSLSWLLLKVPGWLGYVIVNRSLGSPRYPLGSHVFDFMVVSIGFAVLAAWSSLAISGRWKPEPSWVDRLGRFLGFTWIALLPVNYWAAIINP